MKSPRLISGLILLALQPLAAAQGIGEASFEQDVEVYNDHIVTLASPWMEGRLPGTRGMELAREYMEYYFRQEDLEPAFEGSFRQQFELAPRAELVSSELSINGTTMQVGAEYTPLSLGASGELTAPAIFVGYSLPSDPDSGEYQSYRDEDDLSGKIAVMFRLEPMSEEGTSLLSERGWSRRMRYADKVKAAAERGAVAVIMINSPGANHDGMDQLMMFSGRGGRIEVPVMNVSIEGGEKLIAAMAPTTESLLELRQMCDDTSQVFDLDGEIALQVEIVQKKTFAENVGAVLPGRGELENELVVIGAHLDHLGMGYFGSRADENERGLVLHPGADDNASGSAAVLMIAKRMVQDYAAMGDDANLRSVLFMGFDAEESGLNGARYYADNPIIPIDDHALMINFDMIGRITNKRLSLSGAGTGTGLAELLEPILAKTELDIVQPEGMSAGSDHLMFYAKGVPVLFSIIADFHDDYHTPRDTSAKINREDAVRTVNLFHEIGMSAVAHPEGFDFQSVNRRGRNRRRTNNIQFGITLANANGDPEPGLLVNTVTAGSPAELGGVKPEDRILTWNDDEIDSARAWRRTLAGQEAGDEVTFDVRRGSEVIKLKAVLKAARR